MERFLGKNQRLWLENPMIISQVDLSQISKDVERINVHPVLKSKEVRAEIHKSLLSYVVSSEKANYIQGIDTIAGSLYVIGFENNDHQFIEMIPSMLHYVYKTFSRHFIHPTTGHLDFTYS